MNKKQLSERDICTKYITPALVRAGWNILTQVREEFALTQGRIVVRGKLHTRAQNKRADYVLFYKPNIPIAIIEAKDNTHTLGDGMQQGLGYAEMLQVPFVFSSNGDGFLFHNKIATDGTNTTCSGACERELSLNEFPSPEQLWQEWAKHQGLTEQQESLVIQDYYSDGSNKTPRYYQLLAINKTIEAIAKGQNRILLVMATGTGKTFTAFQIIWRLWKSKTKKRILFLADRNILVDQTMTNDFKPFGGAMTKIQKRQANKAYEIYLSLYQAVTGSEEEQNIYKQFSPDFFDLIIVDECHRGSAAADSAWRQILEYFASATQIGLTATPKETKAVSNIDYFGEPIYTYSLKQGIEDGFLAPYKVVRFDLDKDLSGWRPSKGTIDKHGNEIEDRIYNQRDFDRTLVLEKRTQLVARKITEFLKQTNRFDKKGIPFLKVYNLKVYNIRDQKLDFQYKPQFVDEEWHLKAKRSCLKPGDVIMNIVGPPLGKVAIIPEGFPEYNCNQAIVFFRPVIQSLNKYLYLYLLAGKFLEKIELIGTAGQDNISVTKSRSIPIPLPPLAEQKRIVAKVDRLMSLCDRLEQQIDAATDKRTELLNALIAQV
ncbi:hypothetical protein LEP3755_57690 [Leptolyngbya sp. NIES-3755]|nr:hypothetical protein LEP3755_57690 [Leptolyngbya sp. NIES-3755]